MNSKFKLNKEKREGMISSIKYYFQQERDEPLGDLAASLILDFFIEKLAIEFYNQGVFDAHQYMSDSIDEMLGIQKY